MKSVLIVGGSRGIGRAVAERLIEKSEARIVLTYHRNEQLAKELCQRLGEERVAAAQLQLEDREQLKVQLKSLFDKYGPFDVVVHSAAILEDTPLYFMTEAQWHSVIDVPLNSFYYVNKICLQDMIEKRFGRIISLVSVSGEAGNRGQCNYAAAKGAIISASKSLAKEMASRGITVNCVSPGVIETDMTKDLPKDVILPLIPAKRFGSSAEVAAAVCFLATKEASYINGEVIRVNGGMYT